MKKKVPLEFFPVLISPLPLLLFPPLFLGLFPAKNWGWVNGIELGILEVEAWLYEDSPLEMSVLLG